jgi:hypothetical protein
VIYFAAADHKYAITSRCYDAVASHFRNPRRTVTYCLGIMTAEGLVLASDSRTNAGFDQVNTCRKMHQFVHPGERVFVILTSGSLSISQSVVTLLRADFDAGRGLAQAASLYDAARIVGDCVRRVSDIDRSSLERDSFSFNVHLLLGGQVRGAGAEFVFDLSAGESFSGYRGFAVFAVGGVQIRTTDSGSRNSGQRFAGSRGEICAAFAGCHHAIQRYRGSSI